MYIDMHVSIFYCIRCEEKVSTEYFYVTPINGPTDLDYIIAVHYIF